MLAFKYKNCGFKYQVAGFYKILNTLSEHKSLSWLLLKQQKKKSVKQRSAFAALQPKWTSCHKANSKSHNECCNWALMFLRSSQTENMCHNQPPVIATPWYSQRNKLYQLIHPKISLHRSLQWYIFKWKYIYIICGFFTVVCTVLYLFVHLCYAYITVTLRESIESLERERERVCGLCFAWKKSVAGILFCNISNYQCGECCACLSSQLANDFGGWLLWKACFFFSLFFLIRTQLVETAKNICFGTDLHCSDVHSFLSMAMIVTTNTSDPLW